VRRFANVTDVMFGVAFSPDGRSVLAAGGDGVVRLWEVETGQEVRRYQGHTAKVNAVAFSRDGRRFLSGGADNALRYWAVPR
jgi:WD40 repeat protein